MKQMIVIIMHTERIVNMLRICDNKKCLFSKTMPRNPFINWNRILCIIELAYFIDIRLFIVSTYCIQFKIVRDPAYRSKETILPIMFLHLIPHRYFDFN